MGYCYDMRNRLVCDRCGKSGGVRKRTCPFKVHYGSGAGFIGTGGPVSASLPYCYPSALCKACYAAVKATLHDGCKEGAAKSTAEEAAKQARHEAGESEVKAAWGDWEKTVPKGMTGVLFRGLTAGETWRLVPAGEYDPGAKHWLADYPDATPWAPHA